MSRNWYYADRNRQQQGPVGNDALAAAFARGEVDMSTLVWHEQLPSWVPLQQVAAELGLRAAAPPPPPQQQRQPLAGQRVAKKSGGAAGWVIALVVVGFVVLVFGGILAAIAVPAYNDYTVRARISQAMIPTSSHRIAVAEFYMTNGRCPHNGDESFGAPQSYASEYTESVVFDGGDTGCFIATRLRNLGNSRVDGAEYVYTMDKENNWTFSSTVPDRYLSTSLRGGNR